MFIVNKDDYSIDEQDIYYKYGEDIYNAMLAVEEKGITPDNLFYFDAINKELASKNKSAEDMATEFVLKIQPHYLFKNYANYTDFEVKFEYASQCFNKSNSLLEVLQCGLIIYYTEVCFQFIRNIVSRFKKEVNNG